MPEVQWWYARGDDQLGPVSPADLRRLAAGGGLGPGDLVWREGMNEWAPAARIKGLFPDAPPADDAPPAAVNPTGGPPPNPLNETIHMPEAEQFFAPGPAEPELYSGGPTGTAPPAMGPIESGLFRTPPPREPDEYPPEAELSDYRPPRVPLVLLVAQGMLWGTCGLVVLLGGLLFTLTRIRGTSPAEEAASATVLGMFFIGAYVAAQAGDKISKLVMAVIERRRGQ